LARFEVRGCELEAFEPRASGLCGEGTSGTAFEQIDLSAGDWCDFDDKAQVSVGVYNPEFSFEKT